MTREEAIRIVDLRSTCRECMVSGVDCDDCDSAFAMAIEALKQPEIVRCKDCKHRPKKPDWENYESVYDIEFPDEKCPCQCSSDEWYSWYPEDDWFCAEGERK